MSTTDSALIVVDVQRRLIEGDDPVYDGTGLLSRLRGLIARARERGAPVVYILDDEVAEVGTPDWDVHPDIAPEPGDRRVRKEAADSFHETELQAVLAARGIRHLVIAGLQTDFCVDTTCRRAITLGYPVTLVADGHSTVGGPELPATAIIAHHNRILDEYGAYVAGRVCEVIVAPADTVRFDRAHDVPSSVEEV